MKKKLIQSLAGLAGIVAVIALCLAWGSPDDTGPTFQDYTRTNTWTWSTNFGMPPVLTIQGTNYTAITTNFQVLHINGVGGSNTLQIVDGLIVGIQ